MTMHSEALMQGLSDDQRSTIRDNGSLVLHPDLIGSNLCGTYHSAGYMASTFGAELFDFVDVVPEGVRMGGQDIFVYRRRS